MLTSLKIFSLGKEMAINKFKEILELSILNLIRRI